MQYIRRRIQRVSGVTIRDERVESRDFPVQPPRENWDSAHWGSDRGEGRGRTSRQREARAFDRIGAAHRERT